MSNELAIRWWAFVVRGALAILFGIVAFVWPGLTILTLTFVFGFYALFDGVMALFAAWSQRGSGQGWVLLLEGILGILFGVVAFLAPAITALSMLFVIAFWAIITGVLEIIAAIRLRNEIENEWSMGLAGALSVLFGILLLVWPASGLLGLTWLIGIYAIIFGVSMIMLGFRLKGVNDGGSVARTA
jgi:uncharacterized membrane protein HdeD (DUF308 family)